MSSSRNYAAVIMEPPVYSATIHFLFFLLFIKIYSVGVKLISRRPISLPFAFDDVTTKDTCCSERIPFDDQVLRFQFAEGLKIHPTYFVEAALTALFHDYEPVIVAGVTRKPTVSIVAWQNVSSPRQPVTRAVTP